MTPHTICKAMGNQYRYRILELLVDGEKNVGEMNKAMKTLSQPVLSQHLGKLHKSGLITKRRNGRYIYCGIKPKVWAIMDALEGV